jgi:hypothetical protein
MRVLEGSGGEVIADRNPFAALAGLTNRSHHEGGSKRTERGAIENEPILNRQVLAASL